MALLARDDQKSKGDIEYLLSLLIPKRVVPELPGKAQQRALSKKERKKRAELLKKLHEENREEVEKAGRLQRALVGIYDFCLEELLTKETLTKKDQGLAELFQSAFRKTVPCKEIDGFEEKYLQTFGAGRDPQAIASYSAKIDLLNDPQVSGALETFVSDVLEGSFAKNRYLAKGNPHLERLLKSAPELFTVWQKGLELPLGDVLMKSGSVSKEELPNFKEILERKLMQERHLGDLKETFPDLFAYFKKKNAQKSIQEAREKALEAKRKAPRDRSLQKRYDFLQLQFLLISLMEAKNASLTTLAVFCRKILTSLNRLESPNKDLIKAFRNDIEGLEKSLRDRLRGHKREDLLKTWKVVETDHWEDLLLSGSEVLGSCQNVCGDPKLNKCLLAYLLDGKNRLLAVKDREGRIKARAVLRLLFAESPPVIPPGGVSYYELLTLLENGNKPALFLERVYPDAAEASWQTALLEAAKEKARKLKLDLYTFPLQEEEKKNCIPLKSLGSPAPFEYVDAAGGIKLGGLYTVLGYRIPC